MSADKPYKKLRIFVASPGDVATERARLYTVVEEFNRTGNIADWLGLTLEALDWRTHVAPLMGRAHMALPLAQEALESYE